MIEPVKCAWPPKIHTLNGKKFIAGGDKIMEVPLEIEAKDIPTFMVWEGKQRPEDLFGRRQEVKAKEAIFEIEGSGGNKYKVTLKNDVWHCECIGFNMRKKCKHVVKAKENHDA